MLRISSQSILLLLALLLLGVLRPVSAQANQAVASVPLTATVEPDIKATCDGYVNLGRIVVGDTGTPSQLVCTIRHNAPQGNLRISMTPSSDVLDLQNGDSTVTVRLVNAAIDKGFLSGSFKDGFVVQKAPVGILTFRATVQMAGPLTSKSSAGNYTLPINFLFSISP